MYVDKMGTVQYSGAVFINFAQLWASFSDNLKNYGLCSGKKLQKYRNYWKYFVIGGIMPHIFHKICGILTLTLFKIYRIIMVSNILGNVARSCQIIRQDTPHPDNKTIPKPQGETSHHQRNLVLSVYFDLMYSRALK